MPLLHLDIVRTPLREVANRTEPNPRPPVIGRRRSQATASSDPPERGPRGTDPSPPTGFGRGRRRRCRSRTPSDVRQRARAALARAQPPLRGLVRRGRRSSPPSDDRSKVVHGGTFDQAAIADKANRAVELARSCLRALFADKSEILALSDGSARSLAPILDAQDCGATRLVKCREECSPVRVPQEEPCGRVAMRIRIR